MEIRSKVESPFDNQLTTNFYVLPFTLTVTLKSGTKRTTSSKYIKGYGCISLLLLQHKF